MKLPLSSIVDDIVIVARLLPQSAPLVHEKGRPKHHAIVRTNYHHYRGTHRCGCSCTNYHLTSEALKNVFECGAELPTVLHTEDFKNASYSAI